MGEALITRRGGGLTLSNACFNSNIPTNIKWYTPSVDGLAVSDGATYSANCQNIVKGQTYILKYNDKIVGYAVGKSTLSILLYTVGTVADVTREVVDEHKIKFYEVN